MHLLKQILPDDEESVAYGFVTYTLDYCNILVHEYRYK